MQTSKGSDLPESLLLESNSRDLLVWYSLTMENMFNSSTPMTDHSHIGAGADTSRLLSDSFIQSGVSDHIECRQPVCGGPFFRAMQDATVNDLCIANDGDIVMPHVNETTFNNLLSSTASLHNPEMWWISNNPALHYDTPYGYFTPSNELSLSLGSSQHLESRFLHATRDILAEIASFALRELDDIDGPLGETEGDAKLTSSSSCITARGLPVICSDNSGARKYLSHMDHLPQQQATDTKKPELLTILQEVDRQCKQYIDQINSVISAFHGRIETGGPQMNIRFALHTVSAFYKNLRNRIASQIAASDHQPDSEPTAFIQKRLTPPAEAK